MKISVIGARGIPDVEGGAEKNAEMLFPLIAKYHDVTLYSIQGYSRFSSYREVKIIETPKLRVFGTDKIACYIFAALDFFRTRPDIVHCQGLGSAIFLFLYKLSARRVVVRYGSVDYRMAKWSVIGQLGFRLSEWQLRFADSVIAVAPSLRQELLDRGYRVPIELIPNAIDTAGRTLENIDQILEHHELQRGRYVLGVGRLTAQKDFKTLIRAFKRLRIRSQKSFDKLVIVGGDDGSGCYQQLLDEADESICLAGRLPRSALGALYAGCGVYVNCSLHEGMSNAVLEAISSGCPVLLSDIAENQDLPVDKRHFFSTGNPASLAELLERVAKRPRDFIIPQIGFTNWQEVAAKTLSLYESLFEPTRCDAPTSSHTKTNE